MSYVPPLPARGERVGVRGRSWLVCLVAAPHPNPLPVKNGERGFDAMSRRKKGKPVHGWVILDKHTGLTSTQAVSAVRRLFDAQKAGHAGTLDPLATGVLPIALGEATKTVSFAVEGTKAYCFTVRWGVETDTDDAEGTAVETRPHRPATAEIMALLPRFTGEVTQVPPRYSAVKLAGERAYDLAREGEAVVLAPRQVVISRLNVVDRPAPELAVFEAECSRGTYVRALARDLGRALGCLGHVTALRRTRVGAFDEARALPLSRLEDLAKDGALEEALQPVVQALASVQAIKVSSSEDRKSVV